MKLFSRLHAALIHAVLIPVRFYQKHLSRRKKLPTCRFLPTCSQYCVEAVTEWGILIGFLLSFWRIPRCNPLCKGGYDPVPERKRKKKKNETVSFENGQK
jgi:putative membrane protein insertion efficiency factor